MKKRNIGIVIRIISEIGLLCGAYKEIGIYTFFFLVLVTIAIELQAYVQHKTLKLIDKVIDVQIKQSKVV
jgi:hypothetical protein